jgi:hypothetical protein
MQTSIFKVSSLFILIRSSAVDNQIQGNLSTHPPAQPELDRQHHPCGHLFSAKAAGADLHLCMAASLIGLQRLEMRLAAVGCKQTGQRHLHDSIDLENADLRIAEATDDIFVNDFIRPSAGHDSPPSA